jgi:hypothetical protein
MAKNNKYVGFTNWCVYHYFWHNGGWVSYWDLRNYPVPENKKYYVTEVLGKLPHKTTQELYELWESITVAKKA